MIVSFSVSNFRSFAEEQTLSMVASLALAGQHDDHLRPVPGMDQSVLPVAVLYGANGAGKSNLFKALDCVKSIAMKQRARGAGTGRVPFKLSELESQASTFDLQFVANNRVYRYGVKAFDDRIAEEWLSEVVDSQGTERPIYERSTRADGKTVVESAVLDSAKARAQVTVGSPMNQSFLATLIAGLLPADVGEHIVAVIQWFDEQMVLIAPDMVLLHASLNEDAKLADFASQVLRSASTGIERLRVRRDEWTDDEIRRRLPSGEMARITRLLGDQPRVFLQSQEGTELVAEQAINGPRLSTISVDAVHKTAAGKEASLDWSEESDGTRRFLELVPALYETREVPATYIIDEIDRSLHAELVREFFDAFLTSARGSQRQLIVTTHETTLLDLDMVRRDEVWFAEKDSAGATHLHSLLEFRPASDHDDIRKRYLEGRYGGVPFLAALKRMESHP